MRTLRLVLALTACSAFADIVMDEPVPAPKPPAPVAKPTEPTPEPVATPAPAPVHPEGIEKAAPTGVIEGGWPYVVACWVIALGGTALYALSLFLRLRDQKPGVSP